MSKLLLSLSLLFIQNLSVESFSPTKINYHNSSIRSVNQNKNHGSQLLSNQFPSALQMTYEYDSTNALTVLLPTSYIVVAAIILGILSQAFINTMLRGDQGLSAFLSDGKGFNKSNFKSVGNSENRRLNEDDDPLPWLKLPKLDFVDVAGQSKDEGELELLIVKKLETLTARMRTEIKEGDKVKAASTMKELNELMEKYGFEYKEEQQFE
jgi:hypothetical protein